MPEEKGRRVLIIHRYFWPENNAAFAVMLGDVVKLHLERGDRVRVVFGLGEDRDALFREAFGPALGDRLELVTFRADIDRRHGMLRRILTSARLAICGLRHLVAGPRWDLVYTVSYPPFLASLIAMAARLSGRSRHVIYYVQDNLTYRVPTRFGKRVYAWAQRLAIRRASRVVTLSEAMKDGLKGHFREAERAAIAGRITVIPNFSPLATGEAVPDLEPVWDVIYAGNHGAAQNLQLFLDMIAAMPADRRPRTAFFGDGTEKPRLIARARALGVDVAFHDPVPAAAIRPEIARARFGLVGARPGLMRYAFPSKLAGHAALGTPSLVMCDPDQAFAVWLAETGLGGAIDAMSAEQGAADLLRHLSAPPPERHAVRAAGEAAFSREGYLAKLARLLDGLS